MPGPTGPTPPVSTTADPWPSPRSAGPTIDISPYPPNSPTNLTATAHTTSITLNWTASRGGCCTVDHYEITYFQSFDDVGYSARTTGAVPTVTVTQGIRAKQQYLFYVTAVDIVGHRSGSSAITVVTPASDTASDQTPPSAPADLTVAERTASGNLLTWHPSTDNVGVVAYDVYLFDGWFSNRLVTSTTGTAANVPYGTSGSNSYYVRARDAAGNVSIGSNVVPAGIGPSTSVSPSISMLPPPPSSSPPPPPPGCTVSYHQSSTWSGGFLGELTVTNTSAAALNGWKITFTFTHGQKLQSTWDSWYQQTGADVTLPNPTWKPVWAAGASIVIGMVGTTPEANGTGAAPAYALNGVPCAIS